MKPSFTLIALFLLTLGIAEGQRLVESEQNLVSLSLSPIGMIEVMEHQLMDQFKGSATVSAQQTTARLLRDRQVIAHGTIINGRDQRYSYLLCPADVLQGGNLSIQTQDGKVHQPAAAPVQILSEGDNLAIIRLPFLAGVLSIKSNQEDSPVGAFVGILANDQKWKVGAITNSKRSAYNGIPESTQKALSKHWDRIGLKVNTKRSGYPEVIESDLPLVPTDAGSPVFDRSGKWHGVAIARVDQHSTLVIPAKRVSNLVAEFEFTHL